MCVCVLRRHSPLTDEGAELGGEGPVVWQAGGLLLQHPAQHLKVRLAVLVRKLARGQLHLGDNRTLSQEDGMAPSHAVANWTSDERRR